MDSKKSLIIDLVYYGNLIKCGLHLLSFIKRNEMTLHIKYYLFGLKENAIPLI